MLNLTRLPDWKQHLTMKITECKIKPFLWGSHDCALWGVDCINSITGIDLGEKARGTYSDAIGAFKCLKTIYNTDNVKQAFSDRFEEVHQAFLRPGDIAYKNSNFNGFNVAIGVCYGKNSFFLLQNENGLVEIPTLLLDGGFRV